MIVDAREFSRLASFNALRHDNGAVAVSRDAYTRLEAQDSKGHGLRTIKYLLSSDEVARDGHRLLTAGLDTTSYEKNPVVPFGHDVSSLPVGKMISLTKGSRSLIGVVQFAPRELNPLADSVYEMTRQGFLSAVSVSWLPIKWQFSTDRSRGPGAIDFEKSELLEVSVVPVPALASALAQARSAGIDTVPIRRWAEEILDRSSLAGSSWQAAEQARQAALGRSSPLLDQAQRERRRRTAEVVRLRVEGEDRAVRARSVEVLRLAGAAL